MKHITLIVTVIGAVLSSMARPTDTYYTATTLDGKNGRQLEIALFAIVNPHTKISYDNLWDKFKITDVLPAEYLADPSLTDQVYDMYANWSKFPKYHNEHTGVQNSGELHTQTGGFNREHCVPNGWWGKEAGNAIAYNDLHHLTPADGAANNGKSDHPLGEYQAGYIMQWPTSTKTYSRGGNSGYVYVEADNTSDHSGSWSHVWKVSANTNGMGGGDTYVWEPCDEFKGDFARMYFYVVCAYEGQMTWQTTYMFTNDANGYTDIKPWALELLLKWHRQDPVSQKELDRNDAVYGIQNNRNPFIDYPELVEYIWGDKAAETFTLAEAWCAYDPKPVDPADPDPDPEDPQPLEKADPMLYFPHIAYVGMPFTAPRLNTLSDGVVRYTSSNPAVATVDARTGEVTPVSPGVAIISVVQASTGMYHKGTANYMIKVVE